MINNSKIAIWKKDITDIDFIYKTNAKNIFTTPKIDHISTCSYSNDCDMNFVLSCYANLYLIINQKPLLIRCVKPQVKFNTKKGSFLGVKLKLRKKSSLRFIETITFFMQSNTEELLRISNCKFNMINVNINNNSFFSYPVFKTHSLKQNFNCSIYFNSYKKQKISHISCFLSAFQIF